MRACFKKNRKDEDRRIAFQEVEGQRPIHIYPGREEEASTLLGVCEVMISKIIRRDDATIRCAFARRPTEDTVRVVYDGFEISGPDCSTSARYWILKPGDAAPHEPAASVLATLRRMGRKSDGTVYPGLLLGDLVTADNVNPPRDQQRTPGFGYIEKYQRDGVWRWRLAGVDSFDELILNGRAPS